MSDILVQLPAVFGSSNHAGSVNLSKRCPWLAQHLVSVTCSVSFNQRFLMPRQAGSQSH